MIICHKHKYLIVEGPRTASTAISLELRELYNGEAILRKHFTFNELYKQASPEERKYFVFAGIRNPIHSVASYYHKVKSNHKQAFTTPKDFVEHGGWIKRHDREQYQFVLEHHADFAPYFKHYFGHTFIHPFFFNRRDYQFIIRFERLQDDFERVLKLLGIPQARKLPIVNKTAKHPDGFTFEYVPEIQK